MQTTAKEISTWAFVSIDNMTHMDRYRSMQAVYKDISRVSGLSVSLIQQFHRGTRPNLTATTLDMLVEGIKTTNRLNAA